MMRRYTWSEYRTRPTEILLESRDAPVTVVGPDGETEMVLSSPFVGEPERGSAVE